MKPGLLAGFFFVREVNMRFKLKMWQQVLLLAIVVLASYWNSLSVPFLFDDLSSIRENPAIRSIVNPMDIWGFSAARFLTYYSFALNFAISEYQVSSYHWTNLLIHLGASSMVFLLARKIQTLNGGNNASLFPLIAALIFALHPLHVQAVTYIVQRAASMAALFYLLSLFAYIQARTADKNNLLWGALCLLAAIAAMFSKQNAATLPLVVIAAEIFLISGWNSKARLGLMALAISCGVLVLLFEHSISQWVLENATETSAITRVQYLATQSYVIWGYIFHLIWPADLQLEYAVPLASDFFNAKSLIAATGHCVVLIVAIVLPKKYRIVSFGIFFYYLAHLIESALIPIRDLAFDHRTYLPDVGLIIAGTWLALETGKQQTWRIGVSLALVGVLAVMTWQRNADWQDPLTLYWKNAESQPQKSRVWSIYADQLAQKGRFSEALMAIEHAEKAREASLTDKSLSLADANTKVLALDGLGRRAEALQLIDVTLKSGGNNKIESSLLTNKGYMLMSENKYAEAQAVFEQAQIKNPQNLNAKANLAIALAYQGQIEIAIGILEAVQKADPTVENVASNLAQLRQARGK